MTSGLLRPLHRPPPETPRAISPRARLPFSLALAAAHLLVLAGCLANPAARAGTEELVAAERAFAASVLAQGMKAGFKQHLADDAVLLRPRPLKVGDFLAAGDDDPGLLEWAPAYARLTDTGDFGFTLGPWRYRSARTNTTIQATGFYVTVWRRTPAGWRAALDGGIGTPAMELPWQTEVDGPGDADDPLPDWQQNQRGRDLRYAEETFGRRAAREGEAVALENHGHKRVRVLRSGAFPVVGRSDGVRFLRANRRLTRDALQGYRTSAGGDLGYAWGESELLGSGTTPAQPVRSWMRVWRRSGWSGTWRVVLDLAIDYPPAPAAKNP